MADRRRQDQQEALKVQIAAALKDTTPAAIAEACGVSVQAVSGWKSTGKVATEMLLPMARAIGCRVDDLLTKGAPLRSSDAHATFEGPPPTVEQAIEVLTLVLASASPVERAVTRGAFEGFLLDPVEGQRHLTKVMLEIAEHPSGPPAAPPESGTRRRRESVSARKAQPARLSVIPGGGSTSQLALPLKKAISPRRNPFDESSASWDERQHYQKWTAPKAANE